MKIAKTSDYSQFAFSAENRPLNTAHPKFRRLVESMKKHGWLPSFPMTVTRDGAGKYIIIDGQNRFTAAKSLKIPVLFVCCDAFNEINVSALNDTQRAWSMVDHVGSRAEQGDSNYVYLLEFVKRTGIPVRQAASLLWGNVADAGNVLNALKAGGFEVREVEYAERVAAVVCAVAKFRSWAHNTSFISALSKVMRIEEFNDALFIGKLNSHSASLPEISTSCAGFVELIESMYNRKSRSPVPIKFLTEQAMKLRSACKSEAA